MLSEILYGGINSILHFFVPFFRLIPKVKFLCFLKMQIFIMSSKYSISVIQNFVRRISFDLPILLPKFSLNGKYLIFITFGIPMQILTICSLCLLVLFIILPLWHNNFRFGSFLLCDNKFTFRSNNFYTGHLKTLNSRDPGQPLT